MLTFNWNRIKLFCAGYCTHPIPQPFVTLTTAYAVLNPPGNRPWQQALLTLSFGNTYHARNIVTSVLVMTWAVRMAGTSLTTVFSY
jgi:hypothetical protein